MKKTTTPRRKNNKNNKSFQAPNKTRIFVPSKQFYGDMFSTYISPTGWTAVARAVTDLVLFQLEKKRTNKHKPMSVNKSITFANISCRIIFNQLHQGVLGFPPFFPKKNDIALRPGMHTCHKSTPTRRWEGPRKETRRHGGVLVLQNTGMVLLDKDQHLELHSLKLTVRTWKWAFPKGN